MALSETRKKNIAADYKTGAYSLNKLAKKHKISVNTVKKICTDLTHDNAPLVKALYETENLKKCTKNAQELKAAENVVKNRMQVDDLTTKILSKLDKHIENGKAQKPTTANVGDGVIEGGIIEYDLQAIDYKNAMEAVDKASITLGVNERFSQSNVSINNQNQQQTNNNIKITLDE